MALLIRMWSNSKGFMLLQKFDLAYKPVAASFCYFVLCSPHISEKKVLTESGHP
jgi:hypothetical protein